MANKIKIGKVGVTKFSDLTGKPTTLQGYGITDAVASNKVGAANGVASLDANGKIPSSQIPGSVDEIIEGYYYNGKFYEEQSHTTEITAESSKIYVDLPTNKTYRWGGSEYVVISDSIALGETTGTAYEGSKGKALADKLETYKVKTISVNGTATTPDANGNVDLATGGGSGGTSDYSALENKPSINNVTLSGNKTSADLGLVSAESGKGLSANDYTTAEKTKLGNIATGAQVNVLEGVTVNGTDASVSNKKVSVTVPDSLAIVTQNNEKKLQMKADSTVVGEVTLPSGGGSDYNVSIAVADWAQVSGQTYYSATKTVTGITATDTPIIDIVPTLANYESEIEDWAKLIKAETSADTITFYASDAFTNAVSVLVKVV